MKTLELTSELLEALTSGDYIFQENRSGLGKVNRYCLYAGEELSFSSMRKNMKAVGLQEFETVLKKANKQGQIDVFLDDGTLHVCIPLALHSKEQLKQVEKEYVFIQKINEVL